MYLLLETASVSTTESLVSTFLPIVLMFAVLYFVMIRPQQKKEKALKEKVNSLEIGDSVTTNAGIVGRVVSLKEDTLVIESSSSRLRIKRWAVADIEKLKLD